MELLDCGHEPSAHSEITTGYGIDSDDKKHCYGCCALKDKERMKQEGKITLYLVKNEVTNWTGSLRFPVTYQKRGNHNIAGVRYDVWFWVDGEKWHGIQYGDNTQICRCKRIRLA